MKNTVQTFFRCQILESMKQFGHILILLNFIYYCQIFQRIICEIYISCFSGIYNGYIVTQLNSSANYEILKQRKDILHKLLH